MHILILLQYLQKVEILNNAQRFLRVAWWMAAFPGVAIAMAVLGLNLLGDGLNDVLNPHGTP